MSQPSARHFRNADPRPLDREASAVPAPITANDLTRRFGDDVVVHDLDLHVDEGSIRGFVGPSGSGKTTTVRLLTGVLEPTGGRVRVFDTDPMQLTTAQRRRIGYMPQLGVLYPHLTVTQNLRFVADLYGVRKAKDRIAEALEMLDLTDASGRPLQDCSGGMQRRVALAAAILHEPDVLFLDEPTSGLDPVLRQRLWTRFQELRDEGKTLFVTTQIVSEAAMCDHVGLLAGGTMIADDTPDGLRRSAAGGDTVDLTASATIPTPVLERLAVRDDVRRIERVGDDGRTVRIVVADAAEGIEVLSAALHDADVDVVLAERHTAAFDDVFVALLEAQS